MSYDIDYKFACFEEIYGDSEKVKQQIDDCKKCGSKLIFTHLPDYKNFLMHETARCMDCGQSGKKIIHTLN